MGDRYPPRRGGSRSVGVALVSELDDKLALSAYIVVASALILGFVLASDGRVREELWAVFCAAIGARP